MILTHENFKRELGGLQSGLSQATMEPYFRKAEMWFKKQVGNDLYGFLNELEPAVDTEDFELKQLAEGAIAWYAFQLVQPRLNIKIGDAGFAKMLPSNHVALTKWEYVKLEESNASMLDICIEGFWSTLESMTNQPQEWLESEDYEIRNRLFLKDAAELTRHLPLVKNSVRMFESLKYYIEKIEITLIEETITSEVFERLKQGLAKQNNVVLNDIDKKLLSRIRDAVALCALLEALPYLSVLIDAEGVRIVVKTDSTRNEIEADYDSKSNLIQKLTTDSSEALNKVREYMKLVSSEQQYPTFYQTIADSEPFDIFSMDDDQHPIL